MKKPAEEEAPLLASAKRTLVPSFQRDVFAGAGVLRLLSSIGATSVSGNHEQKLLRCARQSQSPFPPIGELLDSEHWGMMVRPSRPLIDPSQTRRTVLTRVLLLPLMSALARQRMPCCRVLVEVYSEASSEARRDICFIGNGRTVSCANKFHVDDSTFYSASSEGIEDEA